MSWHLLFLVLLFIGVVYYYRCGVLCSSLLSLLLFGCEFETLVCWFRCRLQSILLLRVGVGGAIDICWFCYRCHVAVVFATAVHVVKHESEAVSNTITS